MHRQLVRIVCLEFTSPPLQPHPSPPSRNPNFRPLSSFSPELILAFVYWRLAAGRNLWIYEIENNQIWERIRFCKIDDLLQFVFSFSHIYLYVVCALLLPIATIFFYRANTSRTSEATSLASSLPNVQSDRYNHFNTMLWLNWLRSQKIYQECSMEFSEIYCTHIVSNLAATATRLCCCNNIVLWTLLGKTSLDFILIYSNTFVSQKTGLDTFFFQITESIFQVELVLSCPWYEPQRKTAE